jgi:hypothetical protein
MKRVLMAMGLCALLAAAGCARGDDPVGVGIGDASESGGTGGEGSGPTGTQGSEPADNPAADLPNAPGADGTGGPK